MSEINWHPTPNFLFVSVPERFAAPKGPRSPEGLALTVLEGDDAWAEMEAVLKQGGSKVHFEEKTERSVQNIVRVGQVLQIPPYLDETMLLSGGGPKGKRMMGDITPIVEVGDTVHLDYAHLTDQTEIYPGVYRVPYSAVICTVDVVRWEPDPQESLGEEAWDWPILTPVGGYVLLSRVWADDVVDEDVDGRMVKCRKNKGGLVTQVNVAPLPGEGVVAWVDKPLKGALDELHPGQRVLIDQRQAIVETIVGTEYICIRHDYILGVKEQPAPKKNPYDVGLNKARFRELFPLYHPAYNA